MNKILCKLGYHRPLKIKKFLFKGNIEGKDTYAAKCPCGKDWMVEGTNPWHGFKVERIWVK